MFRVRPTIEKSLRKQGKLARDETLLGALAVELVSEQRGTQLVHENERLSFGPVRLKVGQPMGMAFTDSKLWIIGVRGIAGCSGDLVYLAHARQAEPNVLDLVLATENPWRWRFKMTEDEAHTTADQLMRLRSQRLAELSSEDRTHCLLVHGDTFGRLGEGADALRLYDQAARSDGSPDQIARAEFNAGLCLKRLGDLNAAIARFRRATTDTSAEVGGKAAANLGDIYKKRGELSHALRYFERAKQLGLPIAEVGVAAVREEARQAGLTLDDNGGPETTNPPE